MSCNFTVLAGEDECISFYSAILIQGNHNGFNLGQIRIYIYILHTLLKSSLMDFEHNLASM